MATMIQIYEDEIMAINALKEYLEHLESRPSELLRRIDKIVRLGLNAQELAVLCEHIREAASQAETRIVYQVINHLDTRDVARVVRIGKRVQHLEKHETLPKDTENAIRKALTEGLILNYSFKAHKDKIRVYAPDFLNNVPVLTSNRQTSDSVQGLLPGTKFHFDEDYLRLFASWDTRDADIDLSAVFYDKNFHRIGTCAYYNLKAEGNIAIHSGDIRMGPGKEFIDIDLKEARDFNVRYVFSSLYNYTSSSMDTVRTGISLVAKENAQTGAVHKADEVLIASNINSETSGVLTFVLDLVENTLLWIEGPLVSRLMSNFESNKENAAHMYDYYSAKTFSIYDALSLLEQGGVIEVVSELKSNEDEDNELLVLGAVQDDGVHVLYQDVVNKLLFG